MSAAADLLLSATLTARIEMDEEGAAAGAVYIPEFEIVPTLEFPPAIPFLNSDRCMLASAQYPLPYCGFLWLAK